LYVGARNRSGGPTDFLDGQISLLTFANTARDSDWLTTEYNNQNDNGAFWVATDVSGGGGATFKPKVIFM